MKNTLSHHAPDQGAPFKLLIAAIAVAALAGCSTIAPAPFSSESLAPANQADRQAIREGVEPLTGVLTLDEAMARALKHNLDRRSRMMEEALAMKQLDVSKFDMLPKMLASAGYNWRSNDHISQSRNADNGNLSPSNFISQDRDHGVAGLDFSWSLIDLGLGYYGSKQQAD